jgi:hypothetical protein
MAWKLCDLTWTALSPMRVGAGGMGFVQLTRTYVPGRALWGAITANLARALAKGGEPDYRGVGQAVREHLRLFYLYPCLPAQALPEGERQNEKNGWCRLDPDLTRAQERLLIHAYGQTAIQPENCTAENASLHETEYLASQVALPEGGGFHPVRWQGHLAIGDSWPHGEDALRQAVSRLWIGGDLRYGFGRLALLDGDEGWRDSQDKRVFERWLFDGNGKDATLSPQTTKFTFLAHLRAENCPWPVSGRLEPLLGLEWQAGTGEYKGSGGKVSPAVLCWEPGSMAAQCKTVAIGEYGVWEAMG